MDDLQVVLIQYGIKLLAQKLKIPSGSWPAEITAWTDTTLNNSAQERVQRACKIAGDNQIPDPELSSVFCIVKDRHGKKLDPYILPQKRLALNLNKSENEDPLLLWSDFCKDMAGLPAGKGALETFLFLMRKYGSYLRGATWENDISVFEQFKAVVSLSYCLSATSEQILLVAGDIPGIQAMIYTITSKGAAKSLKGRSFYLQLLNDAVVRAILRELKLPSACVIYNAGGNFKLFARAADEEKIESLAREINRRLLILHGTELSLVLAWEQMQAEEIIESGSCREVIEKIGEKMQDLKRRPWAILAKEEYERIFGRQGEGREDGEGGRKGICSICHAEIEKPAIYRNGDSVCSQCAGYEDLAEQIAHSQEFPYLAVKETELPLKDVDVRTDTSIKPTWDKCLLALGSKYSLGKNFLKTHRAGEWTVLYKLNCTEDFLPGRVHHDTAYGFRFLPNLTPRIEEDDLEFINKHRDQEEFANLKVGNIRDTSMMSRKDATGIPWYGVLRMDIDDLGSVFSERLNSYDLLHTSALSAGLDLFFQGWLNILCQNSSQNWKEERLRNSFNKDIKNKKTPYIIYSGGDDLFVVGPWDMIPHLAKDIRDDFISYIRYGHVNKKADISSSPLTISAGLFSNSHKFPVYQAAGLARQSLEKAKQRKMPEKYSGEIKNVPVKDAVHWLGVTLSWDDFQYAGDMALKLAHFIEGSGGHGASRSLLWLLYDVAEAYKKAEQKSYAASTKTGGSIVYGRWMWILAYGMKRFCQRLEQSNQELAKEVMQIAGDALDYPRPASVIHWKAVRFLELPVRWAELLLRKGDQSE